MFTGLQDSGLFSSQMRLKQVCATPRTSNEYVLYAFVFRSFQPVQCFALAFLLPPCSSHFHTYDKRPAWSRVRLSVIIAAVVSRLATTSYRQYLASNEIFSIVAYCLIDHPPSVQNDCTLWEQPIRMLFERP
jgi:hypothetical protein